MYGVVLKPNKVGGLPAARGPHPETSSGAKKEGRAFFSLSNHHVSFWCARTLSMHLLVFGVLSVTTSPFIMLANRVTPQCSGLSVVTIPYEKNPVFRKLEAYHMREKETQSP